MHGPPSSMSGILARRSWYTWQPWVGDGRPEVFAKLFEFRINTIETLELAYVYGGVYLKVQREERHITQ